MHRRIKHLLILLQARLRRDLVMVCKYLHVNVYSDRRWWIKAYLDPMCGGQARQIQNGYKEQIFNRKDNCVLGPYLATTPVVSWAPQGLQYTYPHNYLKRQDILLSPFYRWATEAKGMNILHNSVMCQDTGASSKQVNLGSRSNLTVGACHSTYGNSHY